MRKRKNQYGLTRDERGIWHCDFSACGKRFQLSCFTENRQAAEEYCASLASRAWREAKLGEAPTLTWDAAVALWFRAKQADGKKDLANDRDKGELLGGKLNGKPILELDSVSVDTVLDDFSDERGWANATRNRYRSFVLGVLNYVAGKGYACPVLKLERRKEPKGRVRWITKAEASELIRQLPLHLQRMVRFSLFTGVRQANCTGLLWQRVDLDRRVAWVEPDDAKAGEFISIPLNDEAMVALLSARDCPTHGLSTSAKPGDIQRKVCFGYHGDPVDQPANTAWLKALARAGIEDFRWHDLRHTFASWHVMGWMHPHGTPTPLEVLQKLGGWADIRMVQKYAHLAPGYVAQWAGGVRLDQAPAPVAPLVQRDPEPIAAVA